jgi:hypothetical protein
LLEIEDANFDCPAHGTHISGMSRTNRVPRPPPEVLIDLGVSRRPTSTVAADLHPAVLGRLSAHTQESALLEFAPVKLGKLNEGGALVHARGRTWGQLIFQDLFKKEQ